VNQNSKKKLDEKKVRNIFQILLKNLENSDPLMLIRYSSKYRKIKEKDDLNF